MQTHAALKGIWADGRELPEAESADVPGEPSASSTSRLERRFVSDEKCSNWGTRAGCRFGKRCRLMHVQHDGRLRSRSPPQISDRPESVEDVFDGWLRRERPVLRVVDKNLANKPHGSGEQLLVLKIEGPPPAEEAQIALRAQGISWQGSWLGSSTRDGGLPDRLYHCTSVEAGLNIMKEGIIRNSEQHTPAGVYHTKDLSNSFYDHGCTVVTVPYGALVNPDRSKKLVTHRCALPAGVIVTVKRSLLEFVADSRSLSIVEVWFSLKQLAAHLQGLGCSGPRFVPPRALAPTLPPGLQTQAPKDSERAGADACHADPPMSN